MSAVGWLGVAWNGTGPVALGAGPLRGSGPHWLARRLGRKGHRETIASEIEFAADAV